MEGHRSGVIREDTLTRVEDVVRSDKNIAIHKLEPALGLAHRPGESSSVMQYNVTSIITLCKGDKENYDEAYKTY